MCASGSAYKGRLGFSLASGGYSYPLYAVPIHANGLLFDLGSAWQGADGTQYGLGSDMAGIPDHLPFSFRASDLATLAFRMAAGSMAGSGGSLNSWFGPCSIAGPGIGPVTMPGQAKEHVTGGRWTTQLTINGIGDEGLISRQDVTAGHSYTITMGGAAYGPGPRALPKYDGNRPGDLNISVSDLFMDPAVTSVPCCTHGAVRLSAGRRLIKASRFGNGGLFTARLHRPGWYIITISARRNPPPLGVTRPMLSSKISLTWRFAAAVADLDGLVSKAPVSVTTFQPQGLDLQNHAVLGSVTPIRMVIWRGRPDRRYRIKTVRLEVSRDGGLSWRPVRVTAKVKSWLADVPNPFSSFVSLRSIVTDVRGDRTVETIYRAYEVL